MSELKTTYPTLPLEHARWTLAKLWFVGTGVFFLVLIAQSVAGKYHDQAEVAWSWALPTVMPTLSLIVTALGASALQNRLEQMEVRRAFYMLSLWLSVVYLVLILATLAVEPFTAFESLELFKLSNLWLAPLQGLVVSSLGFLFFTQTEIKK